MTALISVVVPCYNEERALPFFLEALAAATEKITDAEFEFIFVDDGSSDRTLSVLKDAVRNDGRIKFISFSRNFGKEAAMLAGFERAGGDYVTVFDADLQHSPELIRDMYDLIKTGEYDCIAVKRASRKGEPRVRLFLTHCFYRLINSISKIKLIEGALDCRLMSRQFIDSVLELKENCRFLKGIYNWVGYRTKWIECDTKERSAGVSKWSLWKLLAYSLEGIAAFSAAPLYLSSILGACFCLLAFILLLVLIVRACCGVPPAGILPTLCAVFLVGGVQLFCTGIIGLYVAKTHLEVKNRPAYLVKETNI